MSMIVSLLFLASASLSGAAIPPDKHNWLSAKDKNIEVRTQVYAGSGLGAASWSRFLKKSGDPVGARNHFFRMEIHDKRSGKKHQIPMVPADKLSISPQSRFILVLSMSTPSDGIVLLSREGKLILKEFSLCLRETCTSSNFRSVWFDKADIDIAFSDSEDGKDCLLSIAASRSGPPGQRLLFNICKAVKPATKKK
jgi:hypothetical protein